MLSIDTERRRTCTSWVEICVLVRRMPRAVPLDVRETGECAALASVGDRGACGLEKRNGFVATLTGADAHDGRRTEPPEGRKGTWASLSSDGHDGREMDVREADFKTGVADGRHAPRGFEGRDALSLKRSKSMTESMVVRASTIFSIYT